jgi:microsomal dipeptidase-like Zn-dependent dipeptidase
MAYVNEFAAEHPDRFAVARSPQEVRELFHRTNKTIFVHSIEGGKRLINSQEDANFWAAQGVVFVTLVHLVDCEFGGAAIAPGLATRLINAGASRNLEKEQGLTPQGRDAIRWLANAGILTDLTHMNDKTRAEALAFMEQQGIPPLSTHDGFKPIQNHPRALSEEQVLQIYRNKGLVSLPISGFTCMPHEPSAAYQDMLDHLETYCDGSVDAYQFTYLAVKNAVQTNPELGYSPALPDSLKVDYSIGFQSDFNGWLNHSRPRVGPDGCWALHPDSTYEAIEVEGLAHPGLLPSQWRYLEQQGVDLEPIRRASEKFLRMWEYMLANKGQF